MLERNRTDNRGILGRSIYVRSGAAIAEENLSVPIAAGKIGNGRNVLVCAAVKIETETRTPVW
jgi:hypothetical protein